MKQDEFIKKIAPSAKLCMNIFKIPASFIIANAINESGWGQTKLAREHNNLFGIKYASIKGLLPDDFNYVNQLEYNACDGKDNYATFGNWFECMFLLCFYITNRTWSSGTLVYGEALEERYNVNKFCDILGDIYAPNAKEVHGITKGEMLKTIIREYQLYKYDIDVYFFNERF